MTTSDITDNMLDDSRAKALRSLMRSANGKIDMPEVPREDALIVFSPNQTHNIHFCLSRIIGAGNIHERYPQLCNFLVECFTDPVSFAHIRETIRRFPEHRVIIQVLYRYDSDNHEHPVSNPIHRSALLSLANAVMRREHSDTYGQIPKESFPDMVLHSLVIVLYELFFWAVPHNKHALSVLSALSCVYIGHQRDHRNLMPAFVDPGGDNTERPVVALDPQFIGLIGSLIQVRSLSFDGQAEGLLRFLSFINETIFNRLNAIYQRALAKAVMKADKKFCFGPDKQDKMGVGYETNTFEFVLERFSIPVNDDAAMGEDGFLRSPLIRYYGGVYDACREVYLNVVSWLPMADDYKDSEKEVKALFKSVWRSLDIYGEDKPISLRRYDDTIIKEARNNIANALRSGDLKIIPPKTYTVQEDEVLADNLKRSSVTEEDKDEEEDSSED